MGVVPGSRDTGPWTPEDDPDFEKGSSLTGAPGRDFEDDPDDIDNLDTALDDAPDTTGGDPDDSWDDEEGRAKPTEKRPGGEQAEIDYQKADQMIKKYAGRDIEKAEFWAKKKKQAADAMVGEITINGKKYKPITESIKPTIFDPHNEIKRMLNKINTRQFDRKWKKEII